MQLVVGEILPTDLRKVDLPESILKSLTSKGNLEYPLIFSLSQGPTGSRKRIASDATTHVGVRQFSAPEDTVTISEALANSLGVSTGSVLTVEPVSLPKGSSVTFKTTGNLDWKPLLERWLPTNCTALTIGDRFQISYLGEKHDLEVSALEPEAAVCIIDTDLDLIVEGVATFDESSDSASIEVGKPLVLSSTPRTGKTPKTFSINVDGVAYIGPEHATSPNSFSYRVSGSREFTDTEQLGETFAICGKGIATISEPGNQDQSDQQPGPSSQVSGKLCPTCNKTIPEQSFMLHSSFCARNTVRCGCGATFSKEIPADHWHCDLCEATGTGYKEEHTREHQPERCECGYEGTLLDVAYHRASSCPERLHICRFCHLLVPQGTAGAAARLQGYTGHEEQCGNRTTDCPTCSRPIRLRNLEAHMQEHDAIRKTRAAPLICANMNCPQHVSNAKNDLGLCATCFGPLYSGLADKDGSKLRQRIERRYVLQLSRGCGKSWCTNSYCRTGSGTARTMGEIMPLVRELLPQPSFHFCVDQVMAKKAMFVFDDGKYAREWRAMAITSCSTETEAAQWLERHAPQIGETSM